MAKEGKDKKTTAIIKEAKKEGKAISEATAKKLASKSDKANGKGKKEPFGGKRAPAFEGPGVIADIMACMSKGSMKRGEILNSLCKQFPDRDREKMTHTVQCQIGGKKRPLRIEREKKIKVAISEDGIYSIKK